MSAVHLTTLIEKLRQEQSFVFFYKKQIRQSVQELNNDCDKVFHSLWLSHTLSYGLHRVLMQSSYIQEWSHALKQSESVEFLNASKVISFLFVERYSLFIAGLLDDPRLLSEILYLVETEGLDCAWVVSDLMGVVFGHCIFKQDHMTFLQLMRELLRHHIDRCESSKDLFGGVESVFNHVLSGYCSQLVELRTFLTDVLQDPIMQVLACEDYLEFDVNKAAARYQQVSEHNSLVNSSAFLFSEDLETACSKLSHLATMFLKNLSQANRQLPIGLQWLLGNLRCMVEEKWPHISSAELRRPISDAIFSSILSSPIVNPDSYGIVDPSIIISEVGRYNLSQVMSVLQGCVRFVDRGTSSRYPIFKVVRKIDVNLLFSLVDSIDGVCMDNIPELPSVLPGLKRSAVLASQEQLDNLVGLVAMLVINREGKGSFHSQVSSLLSYLLPPMIEQASRNPYPIITSRPFFVTPYSSSSSTFSSSIPSEQEKLRSIKRRGKKAMSGSLEFLDVGSMPQHGKMIVNPQEAGKGKAGGDKLMRRSMSNEAGLSAVASRTGFWLPSVVLVLPVKEKSVEEGAMQWDFDLLAEDEFMGQKQLTPNLQHQGPEDNFRFSSLLHSLPASPRILNISAAPTNLSSKPITFQRTKIADVEVVSGEEEGAVVKTLLSTSADGGGRVKSMIDAIENEKRTRSNTLPSLLTDSLSDSYIDHHHFDSLNSHMHHIEGTASTESALILSRLNGLMPTEMRQSANLTTNSRDSSAPAGRDLDGDDAISRQANSVVVKPFTIQSPFPLSSIPKVSSMEDSASYVHMHSLLSDDLGGKVVDEVTGDVRRRRGHSLNCSIAWSGDVARGSESTPRNNMSHLKIQNSAVVGGDSRSASSSPRGDVTSDETDRTPVDDPQSDTFPNPHQAGTSNYSPLPGRQAENGTTPQAATSIKKKKKKKWRLFKKRKSTDDQVDKKYMRSHSDALVEVQNAQLCEKRRKRSRSDHVVLAIGMDVGKGSVQADCYTRYMQDYSAKLEERKKHSPNREKGEWSSTASQERGSEDIDRTSTDDDLDRGAVTPPAEMSPLAFKCSLYCNQLKFKLRSSLKNIHSSLSSSHTHVNLREDEGFARSLRYQLILLIQHTLRHSHWAQRDMETALLSEILRMVEPLPNELIEVAVEGVYEDYHRRSAYIAYLVRSQQKFQDAKMQVASVQSAIDRILHINMALFVTFAVRVFLETPGQPRLPQLKTFRKQMENLFLMDEKCSLMSKHLTSFTTAIMDEDCTWGDWEDTDTVVSCLSDYLFTHVYQHVFYPNGSTDKEVDMIFSEHLSLLSKTITIRHKSLQIPTVYHSGYPWTASQRHLKDMAAYKSPHGKLHCIVQSLRILISLLQYARCGDPPGADDLFPVLVYVLILANPPAVLSTCQYIRNFAEVSLQGEDAYWWAQFSTAVEFTKTLS